MVSKEGKKIAIAIHQGACPDGQNGQINEGKPINEEILKYLVRWEKEMFKSQIDIEVFNSNHGLEAKKMTIEKYLNIIPVNNSSSNSKSNNNSISKPNNPSLIKNPGGK